MMKTQAVLAMYLLSVPIALAQTQPKSVAPLKVGYVNDGDFGCGCSLSRNKLDERNRRHVFINPMEKPGYMNLNGETIELQPLASSKGRRKPKVGDRSWDTYTGKGIHVRIKYVVSKVCDPNDEGCEVTYYKAIMTITRKGQKSVVKGIALCGC